MDKLWRLLTATFMISAATGFFVVAYIFSGGWLNSGFVAVLIYLCLFCILFGVTKGILVIIDHHREESDKQE